MKIDEVGMIDLKVDVTNSVLVYEGPSMKEGVKALRPYLKAAGVLSEEDSSDLQVASYSPKESK